MLPSLIARTLFGSSQIPLLVNLDIYLKKRKRELRFSGIEKKGYCAGITSLWLYSKWLQTQPKTYYLPGGDHEEKRDKVTIRDKDWFESIKKIIIDDWKELKASGKLDEFAKLLERSDKGVIVKSDEEVIVKLNELKEIDKIKKVVKNKEQLRSFILLGEYISGNSNTSISFGDLEQVVRDDYDWFKTTIGLITSWDGRRRLTREEENEFERFIYQIEYFQNVKKHAPKGVGSSGFYVESKKEGLEFLEDTQGRGVEKKDKSFFLYSGKSGKQVDLEQLQKKLSEKGVVEEGELIYIGSSNPYFGHATALFKENGKYYYFDSLKKNGEVEVASLDKVAEMIIERNTYLMLKPHSLAIDIFSIDKSGWNRITRTIVYGSIQSIKSLLEEKGLDLNERDENGNTPLILAIERYRPEVVQLLLDEKVDPDIANKNGNTPVMTSAKYNYCDIVKMLLEKNADPNIPNNKNYTPLMMGAKHGLCDVMKLLLANGADPNKFDKNGYNVVTIAASYGQLEVMKLLLDKKLKCDLVDQRGRSPIIEAAEKGHLDVVKFLVQERKIDPNLVDKKGQTPLTIAAGYKTHTKIVGFLLENNANPGLVGTEGKTACTMAAKYGCIDTLRLLLAKKGGLINEADKVGWTPLTIAIDQGRLDVVKFLLERGANLNVPGKNGVLPIILAAKKDKLDIAFKLLEKDISMIRKMHKKEVDALYNKAIKNKNAELQKILFPYKGIDILVDNLFYRKGSQKKKRQKSLSPKKGKRKQKRFQVKS